MNPHLKYVSYLLRHKWFVFQAGVQKTKAPVWRLVIHDASKFLPSEWIPYANYFYKSDGASKHLKSGKSYSTSDGTAEFNTAWLKHLHRNPHHWQHWVLHEDSGSSYALPMPEPLVREMVADWMGAGRAQGFKNDVANWYEANKDKMILADETRCLVEEIIKQVKY